MTLLLINHQRYSVSGLFVCPLLIRFLDYSALQIFLYVCMYMYDYKQKVCERDILQTTHGNFN